MRHYTPPYTIGFFTASTDLEYSSLLANIVSKVAKKRNINIINFLGGSLNSNVPFSQYKYQYQCNVAFNYARSSHIDGIILASAVLSSFLDENEFKNFYTQFEPLPMVSLGINIENLTSVYTNATNVFTKLVSHIITVHHKRHIAFIAGPISNTDSHERYLGYLQALQMHDIPLQPELVYIGDFTAASAKNALDHFLDKKKLNIDAIVCANDHMALSILTELKARNINVPDDILVTGYDNIPSSGYFVPSLTTAAFSLEKATSKALALLVEKIEGRPVHNVIIPSKIYYRDSCPYKTLEPTPLSSEETLSCSKNMLSTLTNDFLKLCARNTTPELLEKVSDFIATCYHIAQFPDTPRPSVKELTDSIVIPLKHLVLSPNTILQIKDYLFHLQNELMNLTQDIAAIQYLNNVINKMQQFIINTVLERSDLDNMHMLKNFSAIRQFLLTITHNISDPTKQLQSIIPSLIDFGIHSCLIYLYPSSITHTLTDDWKMPQEINLYMGFVDGKVIPPETLPCKVDGNELITYALNDRNKNYIAYMHPIFFKTEQLGVCLFELDYETYPLIENITVEIACALKLSATFNVQRETESKLEALSQTDELTHILNRRGFFNLAQEKYSYSIASQQHGILFYADMDGLKGINDTYGHHEGDYAIIAMASILKETFSQTGIIGRIGGDEFVILCTDQPASYIEAATNRIHAQCQALNDSSGKPYLLSISVGGIAYTSDYTEGLESLLSKADKLLYREKRIKKGLPL